MSFWDRRAVRRTRDGRFEVRLDDDVRELLGRLPGEMRQLLTDGSDPGLRRLFPPAYVADEQHEAEYRRLMGDDLTASHLAALDVMESTARATELDEGQLTAWLRAINEVRVVLGTHLDVSEEDDPMARLEAGDPRAAAYGTYALLGALQEQVVDALSQAL